MRQRQRIEDFLEREGFHQAEVRLLVRKVGQRGEHDVVIRIRGGSFVSVRRVSLASFGPLSQRELQEAFGRMCFTSEGLLDGVFVGNITSCFNKRRLQATEERFTRILHELGHPEGRVRAEPVFVDPTRTDDESCAVTPLDAQRAEQHGLKAPPHCVDLVVHVDAGPRVLARFHAAPGDPRGLVSYDGFLGGTGLWLRETVIEPISRLIQVTSQEPPATTALDTDLIQQRLEERLTFEEAGAVDETEVAVSARNAEEYMAQRGRVSPRMTVDDVTYGELRVVDFYASPSTIAFVRSVDFVGNHEVSSDDIVDNAELAAQPRTLTSSGSLSYAMLVDDEQRIRDYYAQRGYPEANAAAIAAVTPGGEVDVTFVIEEGDPFVLAQLELVGGEPSLTPEVLAAIEHCKGGAAAERGVPPRVVDDCRGAPLRPDELDADAQRVMGVYAGRGYPNVEASVETAFSPQGPAVRITVVPAGATAAERAAPKPGNVKQVRLGEVFLEGARDTRREVILRETGLDGRSGEPLDPITLGKGISRLRRTGLFNSVELEYLGLEGGDDRAHVRLALSEKPALTMDTSVGFSTEQLVSLRAEVRHRNLFGSMLDASWLFDFGLFIGRFSQTKTQVRWPRILGSDITAVVVPVSVSYLDEPANVRRHVPSTTAGQGAKAAWEEPDRRKRLFSVGSSVALDWRVRDVAPVIDDKLTVGLALELRADWLNPAAPPITPFSQQALDTVDGLITAFDTNVDKPGNEPPAAIATVTPRVAFNDVDNVFDPRDGVAADLFVRASPPLGDLPPFAVVGASLRGYATFFERLTVAGGVRTRLGYTLEAPACAANDDRGCEWALMQNDLLLLGGERSVRGVEQNEIGVTSLIYDQTLTPTPDPDNPDQQLSSLRPGRYAAVANLELRYSLVRQLFIGELKPAVFIDGGFSTDDFAPLPGEAEDDRWAWSVGAGLRYVLPVGPMSVDVAYSPSKGTAGAHFSFGYVF